MRNYFPKVVCIKSYLWKQGFIIRGNYLHIKSFIYKFNKYLLALSYLTNIFTTVNKNIQRVCPNGAYIPVWEPDYYSIHGLLHNVRC